MSKNALIADSNSLEKSLKAMIARQRSAIAELESSEGKSKTKAAQTLSKIGQGWSRTNVASQLALGQILASFRNNWDSIPEEFSSQYEDSFDRFVQEVYMISPSRGNRYADNWEALLSGEYLKKLPKGIDLYSLNSGRLDIATRLILDGEITKKKWDILSDENLTNRQVAVQIFGSGKTHSGKRKRTHIQMLSRTGELRALYSDGKMEMIGHLSYNTKDLHVRKTIERIVKEIGIEIVP